MSHKPIKAHFICGGKFHDMQFARLQILQMLYENERIYTTVSEDYSDIAAIQSADVLIIIGTSMQVYPAASLMNYVDARTKVYYIDPNPAAIQNEQVIVIPEAASTGIYKVKID